MESKKTSPYRTKYEESRILGIRALQISANDAPLVEVGELTNSLDIAQKELKENKIALAVIRKLPNGSQETIPVKDLKSRTEREEFDYTIFIK